MTPISILLADDHALVRQTLRRWLEAEPDLRVVADVGDAQQAIDEALRCKPDVVVLDIDMPGLVSFDAAKIIRAQHAAVRLIFLSAFFHDRYIEQALAVGAAGYLSKSESPENVIQAIRSVAAGAAYFSPEVQARIVIDTDGARLRHGAHSRTSVLSHRELQVLQYVARGMSKKEIAITLNLSERTVNCHTANMMAKLEIHDRVELARYAIREGLVEP